jgi:hypothetical protein
MRHDAACRHIGEAAPDTVHDSQLAVDKIGDRIARKQRFCAVSLPGQQI